MAPLRWKVQVSCSISQDHGGELQTRAALVEPAGQQLVTRSTRDRPAPR
jgi:hypothetical protein